jgi:hypothetical protein
VNRYNIKLKLDGFRSFFEIKGKDEVKHFFFEKKKQKTFIYCRRQGIRTGCLGAILNG